jgi:hypothetical protein
VIYKGNTGWDLEFSQRVTLCDPICELIHVTKGTEHIKIKSTSYHCKFGSTYLIVEFEKKKCLFRVEMKWP